MSTPETQWILCPACHGKTRTQFCKDTVLQNFPLSCPKCKRSFLISLRECKTEYEIKPDAKTQAYWMEYEYELKEHGFSGEEDYILKLTDMPFEEMFQISKMHLSQTAMLENQKAANILRQRRTWKNKEPGRNARMDFLTKTLEFTSRW